MDLLIENNTDQDLSFISGSLGYSCNSVNGYSFSSMYVNEDVNAGKKVNTSVSLSNNELIAMGITDIAEIEIGFQIETEDYDVYFETGPFKIQTSAAATYDLAKDTYQEALADGRVADITGTAIESVQTGDYYDSHDVKLISAALASGDSSDNVLLELQNTSDQVLIFRIGDFAVNNLVISTSNWDSLTLNPGGRGVMAVEIGNMLEPEEYKSFGIGDISEIAFHAELENSEYDTIADDESVTVSFRNDEISYDESGNELYNNNGIRIIDKGTSEEDLYHNILLTVVNGTSDTIYISDEYDSTSVNGFMVDGSCYSRTIESGQAGAVKYGIRLSSLEDNNIMVDSITEVSLQLNIGSGSFYNYIDQPELTISY